MANKVIKQMGLPKSIANIFTARNIITAKVNFPSQFASLIQFCFPFIFHSPILLRNFLLSLRIICNQVFVFQRNDAFFYCSKSQDALSLTDFELMELLDVGMAEVTSAMAHISEVVCPPCQTVCTSSFIFLDLLLLPLFQFVQESITEYL